MPPPATKPISPIVIFCATSAMTAPTMAATSAARRITHSGWPGKRSGASDRPVRKPIPATKTQYSRRPKRSRTTPTRTPLRDAMLPTIHGVRSYIPTFRVHPTSVIGMG